MFEPEDEFVTDKKASCSREEVVAKMLGWLQGTKRRPLTEITEFGISEEQLKHTHTFDNLSVLDLLTEHIYAAKKEYFASANSDDSVEDIQVKENIVKQCSQRLEKAKEYFIEFDDEVANGDSSLIKSHRIDTEHYGIEHYTMKSVDAWTKGKYGISIIDPNVSSVTKSLDDEIEVDASDVEDSLSKTIANNLYITFGLLVEDLANTKRGKYLHSDGRINVTNVATYIKELADAYSKQTNLPGQKIKTLRTHIDKAIEAKRDALK